VFLLLRSGKGVWGGVFEGRTEKGGLDQPGSSEKISRTGIKGEDVRSFFQQRTNGATGNAKTGVTKRGEKKR